VKYRKNSDTHKFCPKCQTVKPRSSFHRNRKALDGYQGYCNVCGNRAKYASIAKKKEHYLEMGRRNQKARRTRVPDVIRAEKLREYEKHKERYNRSRAAWFAAHPGERERLHYLAGVRRRTREYNAYVEDVERIVVWERDNGVCYLCGDTVSFYQMHLDHVIPISKGGEHSYVNIKATHGDCNQRKSARLLPVVTRINPVREQA